jgi:hypothetical protein
MSKETQQAIGWGIASLLLLAVLGSIAQNPKANPKLRFYAQAAEGPIMQDLESQALYLLKDGVLYLVG